MLKLFLPSNKVLQRKIYIYIIYNSMDIIFSIIHFLYSTCQFSSITIDTFASFANEIEREGEKGIVLKI